MKEGRLYKNYVGVSPSTENPDKLYFVKNGEWDKSYTGLGKYWKDGKWYYMKDGRFYKTFTGLSPSTSFPNKLFYVKSGIWQNTYSGKITFNSKAYNINNGKVV